MDKTRIFVSKHCAPCQVIKEMVESGQLSDKDVEIVDIESDEGFPYIAEFALSGVPSAYRGREKCELKIDPEHNLLHIICPENPIEVPPSSAEDQESPR